MTHERSATLLTDLERDRANALGASQYLRSSRYRRKVRTRVFPALQAAVEDMESRRLPDPFDGRVLGSIAKALVSHDDVLIAHLRGRKIAALDDAEDRDELLSLIGLAIAEDFLKDGRQPVRSTGEVSMWNDLLREAARRAAGPGRESSVQLTLEEAAQADRSLTPLAPRVVDEIVAQYVWLIREGERKSSGTATAGLRDLPAIFLRCVTESAHHCSFEQAWCRGIDENTIPVRYYVPPQAKLLRDTEAEVLPLDAVLDEWLDDPDHRTLLLLGDYGAGKTSACLHLYRRLATESANGRGTLTPVYVALDTFARSRPSSSSLRRLLEDALGVQDASPDGGDRIYLLDGLDEMGPSATIAAIRSNLVLLRPFMTSGSRVVISCRTHLFASDSDIEIALRAPASAGELLADVRASRRYLVAEIQELTASEAQAIISALLPGEDPRTVWEELGLYHDLQDLARRPILLGLIVDSLTTLREEATKGRPITEADIYDAYVETWVMRESPKLVGAGIDRQLTLAEAIARSLYRQSVLTLTREELVDEVRSHYRDEIFSLADLNAFEYATRDASFLKCDLAGSYRFLHGSFFEYFAARAFLADLSHPDRNGTWRARWLSREVAAYLSQMVRKPERGEDLDRLVAMASTTDNQTELWNALHILSLLDETVLEDEALAVVVTRIVPRGFEETSAAVVRQYARVAAKYGSYELGEALIERVLAVVISEEEQQRQNNYTYVNYYGGVDAACAAFVAHLTAPQRKYDRRIHVHVMGELGSPQHAVMLEEIASEWDNEEDVVRAMASSARIRRRGGRSPLLPV
jgi:hypothetical protein